MRFYTTILAIIPLSFIFLGCVASNNSTNYSSVNGTNSPQYALKFQTNHVNFLHPLTEASKSKEKRNQFIDEFLVQSDMQCERFLNTPAVEKQPETVQEQNLYMNMFDAVSFLFGTKYITDTAKQAFSDNSYEGQVNQAAYRSALSSEINQGVRVARSRYAQQMVAKKSASLEEYNSEGLQKDMLSYDQQCSKEYGLIEINRALRAAQQQMTQPQNAPTPAINPVAIKSKVEAATKKVEEEKLDVNASTLNRLEE